MGDGLHPNRVRASPITPIRSRLRTVGILYTPLRFRRALDADGKGLISSREDHTGG